MAEVAPHWLWRSDPCPPGPTVVVDIDGVLSDATRRQHFLEGEGRKNWRAFFDACGEDELIGETARLLELLDPGIVIALLTGRPQRVQPATLEWLARHRLRWDLLIMRSQGNYSAALELKRQTVRQLRSSGFDPRLALEDDRRNQQMFEEEGVPCLYVHSGYYD